MRITKATVDELNAVLMDIIDDTGQRVREAADTWLDDENDADERRDARETLDNDIDELAGQLEDALRVIDPSRLAS